jgi:sterol desaturase/sphingolipid hydroxylase (fatty acid hydroxylase superfamily)
MSFASHMCANIIVAWESFFSIAAILWGVERLFPKGGVSAASQLRSLKYWAFAGAGTGVAVTLWQQAEAALRPHPLVVIPLNSWFAAPWVHWSLYVITPLLGVILYDFFDYWMHRAQHKWFWRFHSIHHSIEELSGINSYFHWSEQFFRVVFIMLPAAYLLGIDGIKLSAIAELFVNIQGYYLHSPSSIHFGPVLRRILADNRFHRIHHSVHAEHFDKNFGAGTTIWDQLFGTAYFPAKDEWPATGMTEQPEARSLATYLWGPFGSQLGGRSAEPSTNWLASATGRKQA